MGNQGSHSEETKEVHRGPETTNNFVELHQKVDQLPTHNSQFAIAGTFFAVMIVVLICYCFLHRMFKRYCKFLPSLGDNIKQHITDAWKTTPTQPALPSHIGQVAQPSGQLPMQYLPPAPLHQYPAIVPAYIQQPMPVQNAPSVALNMEPSTRRVEPDSQRYEEKKGIF